MPEGILEAPAPAAESIGDTGGGDVQGFDAALDDAFGAIEAAESGGEGVIDGSAIEGEVKSEAEAAAVEGEQPAAADGAAAGAPTYQLSQDGKSYIVPKDDLPGLQAARDYAQAVQERFPTPADATAAATEASYFRQLRNDVAFGGEEGAQTVLDFLSGKNVDASYPDLRNSFETGFKTMVSKMPAMLEKMDGDAHWNTASEFLKPYVEKAYARAAESNDPQQLKIAQWADWLLRGEYSAEAPKFDPKAQAATQQTAQMRELESREASLLDRDWQNYTNTSVEGAKRTDFNTEIDKVLGPITKNYDADHFRYIRKGISDDLVAKLREDSDWAREHSAQFKIIQSAYNNAWKQRQPTTQVDRMAQAWKNDFMLRVRRHLPSIASKALKVAPPTTVAAARPAAATSPSTTRPAQASTQRPAASTPPRASNGQFTREQREATFNKDLDELFGMTLGSR